MCGRVHFKNFPLGGSVKSLRNKEETFPALINVSQPLIPDKCTEQTLKIIL